MIDLLPGMLANFVLTTSNGTQPLKATVVDVDARGVRLRSEQGREAQVPWSAIVSADSVREAKKAAGSVAVTQQVLTEALDRLQGLATSLESRDDATVQEGTQPLILSYEGIRQELEALHERSAAEGVLGDRARRSLRLLIETVDLAIERIGCADFNAGVELRANYEVARRQTKKVLDRSSTTRTSKTLREVLRAVSKGEVADWRNFSAGFQAHPRIISNGRLSLNLSAIGEFELPLKVALDDSRGDARAIRVILDQHRGVELVGNTPTLDRLAPNTTATLKVRLMDRRRQGASDDIRIVARLEYLGPNNERLHSTQHKLTVRIRKPVLFVPIKSPFRQFASGVPVDKPEMFFGREHLIADVIDHLIDSPPGRCYGLYGQKRTGKSSVIQQIKTQVQASGALVASLSMAVVDRSSMTESFVAEILDQLREQVANRLDKKRFESLLTRWPDAASINQQPLASLRRACTAARALTRVNENDDVRIVVIVDEFTYLFELLRRDNVAQADQQQMRDFMRQWKSLLEARIFSAMVVGQDTMPYFLRAFPNEFSVMHTERLDYLSSPETESLADRPIRRPDGASRFTGYALPTVHAWTSGHPYFTQILCDRIVSVINDAKLTEISDFEVDSAIESLLSGPREIGYHRFDCLLSADNTGVIVTDSAISHDSLDGEATDVSFRILHRIAGLAGTQNKPVEQERLDLNLAERHVLTDLILRQVLMEKDGHLQIQVLLFAEYLRRMAP